MMHRKILPWLVPVSLLLLVGPTNVALAQANAPVDTALVGADVAWVLTATALVLLVTPGSRSSTAAWSSARILSRPCCRASWRWASSASYGWWSAIAIVGAFAFGGSMALYKVTDKLIPLRVKASDEELGLDLTQHKERADDGAGARQPA
jgi:Ammonium Transporter Family